MRRPNGTGSVYKKSDSKRRKPYVAEVTVGYTDEGKRIVKRLGSFEKRTEAWKIIDSYFNDPITFDNKDITFNDVWELMMKTKSTLSPNAKRMYRITYKRTELLHNTPIQSIKLYHLQNIIDVAINDLAPATVKHIKTHLNSLFKIAMQNDFVDKNYASFLTIPNIPQSTMHKPFTTPELQQLWVYKDNLHVQKTLIYIYTGCRPIELAKMLKKDIDLNQKVMYGGSKTKSGKNRTIPIADCIFDFVKYFKENSKNDTLFGYHSSISVMNNFNKAMDLCGISNHRPHDTRHTFVTMASNYGMDNKILKMIVGHSMGNDTTQAVYTHKNIEQLINAVNMLPYGINCKITP